MSPTKEQIVAFLRTLDLDSVTTAGEILRTIYESFGHVEADMIVEAVIEVAD